MNAFEIRTNNYINSADELIVMLNKDNDEDENFVKNQMEKFKTAFQGGIKINDNSAYSPKERDALIRQCHKGYDFHQRIIWNDGLSASRKRFNRIARDGFGLLIGLIERNCSFYDEVSHIVTNLSNKASS